MKFTREQALERIRKFLVSRRRGDETTCQTVGRLGIFCRGYDHWSTGQIRNLYPWLANKLPTDASREELLELVVAWDEARMLLNKAATTCDAKTIDNEGCLGFDRFTNKDLKRAFPKLFAKSDKIVD